MKALHFISIILLMYSGYSHTQTFHKKRSKTETFGIPFAQPDTITSLSAFDRNNPNRFLLPEAMDSIYSKLSSDTMYYEEQRIENGESIYLNFRFKQVNIWYRYTFWLHYTEDGRHAMRQRVYLDFDTKDLNDDNDLLVYQAHYLAFQILQPFSNEVTKPLPDGAMNQLYYLEEIIKKTCVDKMGAWSPSDLPEFGYVTAHTVGLYEYEVPKEIFDWFENRLYNKNHELYLGVEELTGKNTVFFLFYPIGDVQALHPTGRPKIQYSQFYKSKKPYSTETEKIDFMSNRSYLIALNNSHKEYNTDGSLALEMMYENGILHGSSTTYFYDGENLTSLRIDHYCYGSLLNNYTYSKDENTLGFDLSKYSPLTSQDCCVAKKGFRTYKKYCRKWKISLKKTK